MLQSPLLYITIPYILGIISAVELGPHACWLLLLNVLWPLILKYKNRILVLFLLSLTFFSLGYLNCRWHNQPLKYNFTLPMITGTIVGPVDYLGNNVSFLVKTKEGFLVRIKVTDLAQECREGDRLVINARAYLPSASTVTGEFDYRQYLFRQKIAALVNVKNAAEISKIGYQSPGVYQRFILFLRRNLFRNMTAGLPAETSSLLAGIMLGEKTEIPTDLKEMFSDTGVMHILAVSGLNVGMVAAIFFFIFMKIFRLRKKQASFLLIFVLILFAQVVGSQSSVSRAVLMAVVGLTAVLLERDKDLLNSLSLAALILLLLSPLEVYDVGFQLSFAATSGLILFTPGIARLFSKAGKIVGGGLAVTLGAQLMVTPIISYHFHKFSLVSPLANLLVVPLVGIITILGFASYFMRLIFAPLGNFIIFMNQILLLWLIKTVKFFNQIPHAFIYVAVPGLFLILIYYGVLYWWRSGYKRKYLVYGVLGIWLSSFAYQKIVAQALEVSFIDVGQGDSILIHLPNREVVLIDGGGTLNSDFNIGKGKVAPYLWSQGISAVDTVILTHPHYNHLQGLLTVLEKFKVKAVVMPELDITALRQEYMKEFLQKIKTEKIYLTQWSAAERLNWSPDLYLANYTKDHEGGLTTKLVYRNKTFMFTSDSLSFSGLDHTKFSVYQLPAHGKFITNPLPKAEYLVVSSRKVPEDSNIFSTARDGTIKFRTDGNWLKVKNITCKKYVF